MMQLIPAQMTQLIPVTMAMPPAPTMMLIPVAMVVKMPPSPASTAIPSSESGSEGAMSRQSSELSSGSADGGVFGCVWELSQRSKGCRLVQETLQKATDAERCQLAMELTGHVWQAARSACANYVLQKFIQVLRPQACQFIIDEVLSQDAEILELAKHQYGCRILQRLLETCYPEQMEGVVKILLSEATGLIRHSYGTFVMQVIMKFGTEEQRELLGAVLLQMVQLTGDENCAQVMHQALQHAPQKATVARALVPYLPQMARGRHSHHAVLCTLQLLDQEELNGAIAILSQKATKLWASRYGRLVVKQIPSLYQQCCGLTRREAAGSR